MKRPQLRHRRSLESFVNAKAIRKRLPTANGNVAEEEPGGDERLLGGARWFVHNVQIGWVEAKRGSGQAISDKVDPEELNRNERLGNAECSGEEDGDDLADVGRDEVADELLHVVVDGASLLNSGDNRGEVVVSEYHLRRRFGHRSARTHSDTDLGLLQRRRVVDTVACHGSNLAVRLQILDDLLLVCRLDTSEESSALACLRLRLRRQIVELAAGEGTTCALLCASFPHQSFYLAYPRPQ